LFLGLLVGQIILHAAAFFKLFPKVLFHHLTSMLLSAKTKEKDEGKIYNPRNRRFLPCKAFPLGGRGTALAVDEGLAGLIHFYCPIL
jgi:hypothetical protein